MHVALHVCCTQIYWRFIFGLAIPPPKKKLRATRIASHLTYDLSIDTSVSLIVVPIIPYLRHLGILTAVPVKIVLDVMSCVIHHHHYRHHHRLLPPWFSSFDLFRQRRVAIFSCGVHDLFVFGVCSWGRVSGVCCYPFSQGGWTNFVCIWFLHLVFQGSLVLFLWFHFLFVILYIFMYSPWSLTNLHPCLITLF